MKKVLTQMDRSKVDFIMEKLKEEVDKGRGIILIEKFLNRLNGGKRKWVELEIIEKLACEIISTLKAKEIIEGKIF